jgi:uncharacterized membrane protein
MDEQPQYTPPPPPPEAYYATPPPPPPPAAAAGLSENAASALAYVTFIPAIIFLLVPPYNQSAKIKFHAIQELGLTVVQFVLMFFLIIPILGWLIFLFGFLALLILWVLCIFKASQGGAFKLPIIGGFAASQSGYVG